MNCDYCGKEYNSKKALEKHLIKCITNDASVAVFDLQGNEVFNKHNIPPFILSDFEVLHSQLRVIPPLNYRTKKHIAAVKQMLLKTNITEMEARSIYTVVSHYYPHFSKTETRIAHEKVVGFFPPNKFMSGRLISHTIIGDVPPEASFMIAQRDMMDLLSFLDKY